MGYWKTRPGWLRPHRQERSTTAMHGFYRFDISKVIYKDEDDRYFYRLT
jgi:hypothetical protein